MICTLRIITALLIGLRSQSWFLTFWSNEVPRQFIYLDTNKTHLVGLAEDHLVFICVKNLSKRFTYPQIVQLILRKKPNQSQPEIKEISINQTLFRFVGVG